ncbi:hypothetical protein [Streptomyces sp. NBC_00439]|uniref:hypothetical protein n=1 Tax=Streptomyces sp. NBC_00439 TaxID=2903650 RepID=UPI002254C5E4|nr:hypothetical protein [Streptomyces sp. NBC_00439]MCX5103416.1 hypothetical protein [Streptomyces sp. NBC_00439]
MPTADNESGSTGPEQENDDTASAVPMPEEKPAAPRTHRKVTGVDLEERFTGWTMRRREKVRARTPEDNAHLIRRGVAAAMGAGILALIVATGVAGESFKTNKADNEARIIQFEGKLADAQSTPVKADAGAQLSKLTEAAAADAGKVVTGQQAFAELYYQASSQPGPDNGAPNRATLDIIMHRREMAPLFSKDSFLVNDKEAYSMASATPFDATTEIDPRYAWYIRNDGQDAADPSTYAWTVETVMPDLSPKGTPGATNQVEVVWLCRDTKSGAVLAWASADYTYDGKGGLFSGLDVVVAAASAEHEIPVSRKPDGPGLPELGDSGAQKKGWYQ